MSSDAGRPGGGAPGRSDEHDGGRGRAEDTAAADLAADPDHRMDLADRALASGSVIGCDCCGLLVAPDVILAEGVANGHPEPPPTLRLVRWDGRSVWIYRLPDPVEVAR